MPFQTFKQNMKKNFFVFFPVAYDEKRTDIIISYMIVYVALS